MSGGATSSGGRVYRRWWLSTGIAVLLFASPLLGQAPVEVFVWEKGDDANAGTRDAPLRTLAAAFERVRGNGRPSAISIAGGVYRLAEPLTLGPQESRTAEAPLVIRGVGRRRPVLTGGKPVPDDGWRGVENSDRLAEFLPKESRRRVRVVELAGTPIADEFLYRPDPDERKHPPRLAWQGQLLRHSQWPNRGYAYIDKVLDEGPSTRHLKATEEPAAWSFEKPTGGRFTLREQRSYRRLDLGRLAAEFAATGDMRVEGYLHNDWFYQKEMLGGVAPAKGSLQLVRYTRYGIGKERIKLPRRVRLIGAAAVLDEPGEWCFDHREKKLYLWPPGAKPGGVQVIGGRGLIAAKGVSHVRLERLVFEGFGDTGVNFQGANRVTIAGCEFRAAAGTSVRVQGGVENTIRSCDLHDVGSGLIMSGVPANRKDLVDERNRAVNNHLWNLEARNYGGAASMRGVGAYFAHNVLHNMQTGLVFGDNDFLAEHNEFYNMGYEMGDWNPCYAGADLSRQGNVFRNNLFHHLMETPGANPIAAIRADDGASGLHVRGNLFVKTGRAAVQFHGPASSITGNVVLGAPLLWWSVQNPGKKVSKSEFMRRKRDELAKVRAEVAAGTRRANDKANLIGRAEAVFGPEGWKTNEAWKSRYPNFTEHFDFNDYDRSPWAQSFVVVKNNWMGAEATDPPIHLHGSNPAKTLQEIRRAMPATTQVEAPRAVDPRQLFRSPGAFDFRPARRAPKGGPEIDYAKIGLVKDPYRKSVPDKEKYRREVVRLYRGVSSHRGELNLDAINRRYPPPAYLSRSR